MIDEQVDAVFEQEFDMIEVRLQLWPNGNDSRVNVLPQVRVKFDSGELAKLRESIADIGLLTPLVVALFSADEIESYLRMINTCRVRNEEMKIRANDLRSVSAEELLESGILKPGNPHNARLIREYGKQDIYLVLVAGERRFRAIRRMREVDCISCSEEKNKPELTCFLNHFEDGLVKVNLCLGATAQQVVSIQYSENSAREQVEPEREAEDVAQYWHYLTEVLGMDISLAGFARMIGRSPDTVRKYLRFSQLPIEIIEMVSNQEIPFSYQHGVCLDSIVRDRDKYLDEQLGEEEIIKIAQEAVFHGWSAREFKEHHDQRIEEVRNGQNCLFGNGGANIGRSFRAVVQPKLNRLVCQTRQYFSFVLQHIKDKELCYPESPFSELSVIKNIRKLTKLIGEVTDLILKLMPKKYLERVQSNLRRYRIILDLYEQYLIERGAEDPESPKTKTELLKSVLELALWIMPHQLRDQLEITTKDGQVTLKFVSDEDD
jgi:hypothetical protein